LVREVAELDKAWASEARTLGEETATRNIALWWEHDTMFRDGFSHQYLRHLQWELRVKVARAIRVMVAKGETPLPLAVRIKYHWT
jgi:hypothetical protein